MTLYSEVRGYFGPYYHPYPFWIAHRGFDLQNVGDPEKLLLDIDALINAIADRTQSDGIYLTFSSAELIVVLVLAQVFERETSIEEITRKIHHAIEGHDFIQLISEYSKHYRHDGESKRILDANGTFHVVDQLNTRRSMFPTTTTQGPRI
jgi:hypothetical protein